MPLPLKISNTINKNMFEFISMWFSQGFYHPLQTPQQLLLIISLALLAAQQEKVQYNLLNFSVGILVGFILNRTLHLEINTELILLGTALIISLVCLIKLSINSILLGVILFIAGLLIGYDSSPIKIPGLGDKIIVQWFSGAGLSMTLSFIIVITIGLPVKQLWNGLILRIFSSWLATSALIVLTLRLAT